MPNIQLINQEFNEKRFSRKHIDGYIKEEILANQAMLDKIEHGVQLVNEYMAKDYYNSKNIRISQLQNMDIEAMIIDIFVGIAYVTKEELFTSVSAQIAGRLGFDDKAAAITTMAELIAVLCNTDAFDILKHGRSESLMVLSNIPLSVSMQDYIENSQYLPPMVCKPQLLKDNYSSGYLTHNDSLVLGKGNHHDGDLCLDVLNKMNQVPLKLDIDFLCKIEEDPTFELDTHEKRDQWNQFKIQSYQFYDLIQSQGNEFWLTHKVDKRGRIYAQGYHITSQGSSFKKAMLEFANEELVEGVE